jgi:hypothetical protein
MLFAANMQSASKGAGADVAASPIEFSLDSKGCPCRVASPSSAPTAAFAAFDEFPMVFSWFSFPACPA